MAPGWGLVITAEHASRDLPEGIALGVPALELSGHRAWDPGSLAVASTLAVALGAPLFAGAVSRLVVDLNRREDHAEAVPETAFGLEVPGNEGLGAGERERRLERWHRPFRRAVVGAVHETIASHGACLHLSIHSFVPVLRGVVRGLDVGVLLDPARASDRAWSRRLLEAIAAAGFDARPDEPYRGTDEGFTTWFRERLPADRYAGLEIELSQRLDEAARDRVARALVGALAGLGPGVGDGAGPCGQG